MAKHRKTRQEKRLADQRHVTYHLDTTPAQESKSTEKKSEYKLNLASVTNARLHTANYAYVTRDLRKTALVTAGVLIAQIILFVILNRV